MQPSNPAQAEPISLGATNAYGWIYGLFELAIVVGIILLVTFPIWGGRFYRPFGSNNENDD